MRRSVKAVRVLAIVASLGVVAAACGDDDSESSTSEETPEASADEEMDDAEAGTIVDVAIAADDFVTLVAAVQAADLVETLSGEGPFTVFAPTDAAFEAALGDLGLTAEELLADTETLSAILTYHVVPDAVLAAQVVELDGQEVATVNGASVTIAVDDAGGVMVNDATVVTTDVEASNGVIHIIDKVLLPPQ